MPNNSPQPILLVATAGAVKPVRQALAYSHPDSILLIGSQQSWNQWGSDGVPVAGAKLITVANADDFLALVEICRREVAPYVQEWLRAHPTGKLIADFTGGTKPMSAALTLVSRRWPSVQFQYISGQRMPDGPMLVLDGTEAAVYSPNPWDVLGYQAAEEAITLFDGGSPAAAFQYLIEPIRRASAGSTRDALQTLAFLLEAYAAWDRFEHREAHRLFTLVAENLEPRLHPIFSPGSLAELRTRIATHLEYLEVLQNASGLTRELIQDLLANAVRRVHEQRFDDAVARLYRACEAIGQLRLTQRYQFKDYRFAPLQLFPNGEVPAALRQGLRGDRVKLGGLQDLYALLHALGDPLGAAFKSLGLANKDANPLTARNRSILAHGLRPLHLSDAKVLLDKVMPLAGMKFGDLPLFPKLGGLV